MKKIKWLTLVIVQLAKTFSAYGIEYDGKLELFLEKSQYLLGEPIFVNVKFTNYDPNGLEISADYLEWSLKVYDGNAKKLSGGCGMSVLRHPDIPLSANQSIEKALDVVDCFGLDFRYAELEKGGFAQLPVGKYTVLGTIRNIVSERLHFEVVMPTGRDAEVFQLFDAASKATAVSFSNFRKQNSEQRLQDFEAINDAVMNLYRMYPDHIYTQKALWELITRAFRFAKLDEIWNVSSVDELYSRFYREYPNSPYLVDIVSYHFEHYERTKGTEYAVEQLKKISTNYSPAVQRQITNFIKRRSPQSLNEER